MDELNQVVQDDAAQARAIIAADQERRVMAFITEVRGLEKKWRVRQIVAPIILEDGRLGAQVTVAAES